MYDDFFAKAHELVQKGEAFVTAVVVRAEKPTSAKPGDKAIITADGVMHGWIGGSCAQPTVIKEALKALAEDESRLIRLSTEPEKQTSREGLLDLPMTCFSGGTLEIYIEPQPPRPRLLIVGGLPVAQALAHLGRAMNYHVVAVDLDSDGTAMAHADEVLLDLEEVAGQVRREGPRSPFTYVVIATHGSYDEIALVKILAAHPSYVGLVASPKRAQAVRDYLTMAGVSETEMLPLKAPAGLDIQARRGDEIALSIMAEIVERRRTTEAMDLALFAERREGRGERGEERGGTAVDPICQMDVEMATAKYTHEYKGKMYYFCCAGCQSAFAKEPEKYVVRETAVDPICGMTVEIATAQYTYEFEGETYYFCCAGCQSAFAQSKVASL
ncbi:MAG: YHS domain-containing protein [Ardenticatenaceae bacterium]|nr:YHS domain-containing protein [Ardenticatenaceae bacterium]